MDRKQQFVRLYGACEHRVHAFILSLVPNWNDAEDLLQDTSAVLWRKFDEFEDGTDFVSWAMSVARFEVLTYRRRQRTSLVQFSDETIEVLARGASALADDGDARRDALEVCLSKLGPRDREVVRLRYQAGATTQEVADQLGRTVKDVYKTLNRVHDQLLHCVRRTLSAEAGR